jgi:hypothetical protein
LGELKGPATAIQMPGSTAGLGFLLAFRWFWRGFLPRHFPWRLIEACGIFVAAELSRHVFKRRLR